MKIKGKYFRISNNISKTIRVDCIICHLHAKECEVILFNY